MKYKCIRGVVTSNGAVSAGEVVELNDREASVLMAHGKIVPHHEEKVSISYAEEVVHRDPVPARRGRKPKYVA